MQCLVVSLADSAGPAVAELVRDPDWAEYWDLCLEQTLASGLWHRNSYNSQEHNCFTFVLAFLTSLNQHPFTHWASSKVLILLSHTQKVQFNSILPANLRELYYIVYY